jgi:hypothetical protein
MNAIRRYLTIIAWNIYIGTGVRPAREALNSLIHLHKPEVIALMEATNLYGDLGKLGYQVVQLKPKPLKRGNRPAQANIALLIRNDIKIKRRFALHMLTFWKFKRPQDPRVYRWVLIEWNGRTWKIGAAHMPFNVARRESIRKLRKWLVDTLPGRPTVLVLDANMSLDEFQERIATPAEAKAAGHRIEATAYKHCKLVGMDVLSEGPSDHPAMKYNFRRKRRRRRHV